MSDASLVDMEKVTTIGPTTGISKSKVLGTLDGISIIYFASLSKRKGLGVLDTSIKDVLIDGIT